VAPEFLGSLWERIRTCGRIFVQKFLGYTTIGFLGTFDEVKYAKEVFMVLLLSGETSLGRSI